MRIHAGHLILSLVLLPQAPRSEPPSAVSEIVTINAGGRTLHGVLYRPVGPGPFAAVLYNHGSAPGMLNNQAFEALGPLFASRGWVFFAPYRRGQGLSASAGNYIGDQIADARQRRSLQGAALFVPLLASRPSLVPSARVTARWWTRRGAQKVGRPHRACVP
jgi:poly(3-hydroxybutyrate) depolymerase